MEEYPNVIMTIKCDWRQGFRSKALEIRIGHISHTIGFRITYYIWGADIWIGKVPFLKTIILANVIVWILLYALIK